MNESTVIKKKNRISLYNPRCEIYICYCFRFCYRQEIEGNVTKGQCPVAHSYAPLEVKQCPSHPGGFPDTEVFHRAVHTPEPIHRDESRCSLKNLEETQHTERGDSITTKIVFLAAFLFKTRESFLRYRPMDLGQHSSK